MRTAAIAVLCSPEFLFLKEPAGRLNDLQLASRLGYFLTRSAPDAELLTAKLTQPERAARANGAFAPSGHAWSASSSISRMGG
jgi:hypothetical protein